MTTTTRYKDGNLTVTRIFDAPREKVFAAWVETGKVETWWGCADATRVKSEIEPKVGGKYCHTMTIHGGEYPGEAHFTEYDPPARLAYTSDSPEPGEKMVVSVDFIDLGDQTEVRLLHTNIPTEFGDIITSGWSAAFGKLANFFTD